MFWGLASGEVDPRQFEFEHVLRDIQTLNSWALDGKLEVTAISLAAYPLVQERYVLLPHGASMGSGYGPIVVSTRELANAGLLIHEGQLTYESEGLKKVVDLGEWWLLETGLPLPLGANVARRDLGVDTLFELSEVLRDSIQAGLDNREEAMEHALQYGRGLDAELADRFVGMYVNELTCDYGDEGRQAVRELLARAESLGAYEQPVRVEFVG